MEYILLGLIIFLIIINIILIFVVNKNRKSEIKQIEKLSDFELRINQDLNIFKDNLINSLDLKFNVLNENVERKLNYISDNVNNKINENFKRTNDTFTKITERLTTIDTAQKKIEELSTDIVSLQNVLTDKKSRGIFGEVNLNHIMVSVFGENNKDLYQMQYKFSNGTIADCVLFAPEPLGTIAIDSKFPLENYQIMVDKNRTISERERAEKLFKIDFKKHIDAIHDKYIITNETSDQAILFLPAEAIFAELNAYHEDIIHYAYKKRVWITSPTTLISTLTVVQMIVKNIERDKYTSVIHRELNRLGEDFRRYKERWDKLARSIETVSKDVEQVHITTDKITKKFDDISNVKIKTEDKDFLE